MISFEVRGDYSKTKLFLERLQHGKYMDRLRSYADQGTAALASSTPRDLGETASRWSSEIRKTRGGYEIVWNNSHIHNGVNIALILQTGHGTRTGGYVAGRDYINPAMRPIFDKLADEAWKEVTRDA